MNSKNNPSLSLEWAISALRSQKSKSAALHLAHQILCEKYYGDRIYTFTRLYRIFNTDPPFSLEEKWIPPLYPAQ